MDNKEIPWLAATKIRDEVLAPAGTGGTACPDNESPSDRSKRISETDYLHEIPSDYYEYVRTRLQHVCIGVVPDHNDMFAIAETDSGKYRFFFQMVKRDVTRLLTEEETDLVKEIIADPPTIRITFGDGDNEMIID